MKEVILKSIKIQEAAPLPSRNFFTSLTNTPIQYSSQTIAGVDIDKPMASEEADGLLAPLTDYLNKNLEKLCTSISSAMVHEVIKRLWGETLLIVENALVPPLYGQLDSNRRFLNHRQITMAQWTLKILLDFYHHDGENLGLPMEDLESPKHAELMELLVVYHHPVARLKRAYEVELLQNRYKELWLRLLRLKMELQEDMVIAEKEDLKTWINEQLIDRRKEI